MASIDFYALRDDIRELVHFIFEETDAWVFESYSEYDAELREFRSLDELSSAFQLGSDPHGNGSAVLLQLWFPSVMRAVQFERITLKVAGHSFRYRVSGVGLVQLYLGGESGSVVTASHYGHWSEAGAANPARASRLQSLRPVCRVAELGSLADYERSCRHLHFTRRRRGEV